MKTKKIVLLLFVTFSLLLSCSSDFARFEGRQATPESANAVAGDGKGPRYSEVEVKDILERINRNSPNPLAVEDIFESGLTPLEIEEILDFAKKSGELSPAELDDLRDSLLEIAGKDEDGKKDDIYEKGKGGKSAPNPISVIFENAKIDVKSPAKDLSNVVLEFTDGSTQRFEGLSGHTATFAGTGENAGKKIARAWIKAGPNFSGDGPGYGERFEAP